MSAPASRGRSATGLFAVGRELADPASAHPERTAIFARSIRLTFGELEQRVDRVAGALAAEGLEEGDAIALLSTNRIEWIVTYQAALRCGLILVPVNWHLEADDVAYVLANSGAKALVVEDRFSPLTTRAAGIEMRVVIGEPVGGFVPFDCLLEATEPSPVRPRGTQMIYTSGTTGRPKGVRHRANADDTALKAVVALFGMDGARGDIMLVPAPFYHSGPSRFGCEWPLGAGIGVVLMERFDAAEALQLIEHHRVSHAFLVPTMFSRMLAVPGREGYDVSSLRFVLHGAGPCPVAVKRAMFDWFGPIIHEMYAATEGAGTWIGPEDWLAHPGSVGRVDANALQIRLDHGSVAPVDVEGTVWHRTSGFRYHGDPVKTSSTHDASGEWYTVGDRGRIDRDGFLYLTGRTSECVVSGGVNIYPARIDEALAGAPGIVDGAAFGVPDDDLGEIVAAAVVPDGSIGERELEERVIAHCRAVLGTQLAPRRVVFTDELPRSDAGKLYRSRLTQRFSDVARRADRGH